MKGSIKSISEGSIRSIDEGSIKSISEGSIQSIDEGSIKSIDEGSIKWLGRSVSDVSLPGARVMTRSKIYLSQPPNSIAEYKRYSKLIGAPFQTDVIAP